MQKVPGFICVILLSFSCQTREPLREQPEIKKNPPAEARPSLPPKPPLEPQNLEYLDCSRIEKITRLSCLYPEMELPFPYCEKDDSYAILGVMPFALCTNDPDIIRSHLPYAESHYRPSTTSLLREVYSYLKKTKPGFVRPPIYTKGLGGQAALIAMTRIQIEHQISGSFSQPMTVMVDEQAKKEPRCLFYQYLSDAAHGDYRKSLALALEGKSSCSYYKNLDDETIKLDVLYVQDLLRKALK